MLRDIYESNHEDWEISEAKGEVDGVNVLAKIRGPHFVPDGVSRNKRFYPKELWDKQLEKDEFKSRMSNRTMFGTIGHPDAIRPEDIREGKISHITNKAWIDDKGRGMAESLVLNTPAGRVLNTLFRAGSKLFASSRANGQYKEGVFKNGMPVVDPDNYACDGFDYVIDPGFLEARPDVVETLREDFNEIGIEVKDKPMNEDQNAKVVIYTKPLREEYVDSEVNMDLNEKLISNLQQNQEKLQADVLAAQKEAIELRTKVSQLEAENADLKKKAELAEELQGKLVKFEKLGDDPDKVIEQIQKLTKYTEIEEDAQKLTEKLEKLAKYEELGEPETIEEALDKAKEALTAYKELGSPEEINNALEKASKLALKIKNDNIAATSEALAKELKIDQDKITSMLEKGMTEDEIRDLFKKETDDPTKKFEQKGDKKDKKEEKKGDETSRAGRILENLS